MTEAWARYRLFCVLDDHRPIKAAFERGWRRAVAYNAALAASRAPQ